jgi:hypothetical protein
MPRWVATEEMAGWSEADARRLVGELSDLFRRARSDGRAAYRWTSL